MSKGVYDHIQTEAVRVGHVRQAEKMRGRTATTDTGKANMAKKMKVIMTGRTKENDIGVAKAAEKKKGYAYEGTPQDENKRRRELCFDAVGSEYCTHCGISQEEHLEKFVYVRKNGTLIKRGLEFHHYDPATKLFNISIGIQSTRRVTIDQLLAEVRKCQVFCKSCHRKVCKELKRR